MPYDLPFDPEPSPAIRRSHVWRPAVFWIVMSCLLAAGTALALYDYDTAGLAVSTFILGVLIGRLWEYLDWRAMQ
jgi:uncharacterized membrane protein YjjP (DUF1212 family)